MDRYMDRYMDAAGRQILAVSHFVLKRNEAQYTNMTQRFDCGLSHGTHAALNRSNLISRKVPRKSHLVSLPHMNGTQG